MGVPWQVAFQNSQEECVGGEGLQEEEAHMGAGVRMETGCVSPESPTWWQCYGVRMEVVSTPGPWAHSRGEARPLHCLLSSPWAPG